MTTKNETRTPQVERPKFLVSIVERGKGKAIINLYNKEGVNYCLLYTSHSGLQKQLRFPYKGQGK